MIWISLLIAAALQGASPNTALETVVFVEGQTDAAELASLLGVRGVDTAELKTVPANALVVVPNSQAIAASALKPLLDHLDRGGHLLAAGGMPFDTLLFETPAGDFLTEAAFLALPEPTHSLTDWGFIGTESYTFGVSPNDTDVQVSAHNPGMQMNVEGLPGSGWATVNFSCNPAPAGHNVFRVRAQALGVANAMLIEIIEQDGSRWLASLPLTNEMAEYGLRAENFAYWRDNPSSNRGGPGDKLRLDQAARIALGFASSHQVLREGPKGFIAEAMGTAVLAGAGVVDKVPPIEGLCPEYKTFESSPVRLEASGPAEGIDFPLADRVVSPVARPMTWREGLDTVWQPVVKGYNAEGVWSCTPVSITWKRDSGSRTLLGYDPGIEVMAAFIPHLAAVLAEGPQAGSGLPELLKAPREGLCVTAGEGEFLLDGKRWYANGINFWPLYVSGLEPYGYFSHWLEPRHYIPELIDADLDLLEKMGVNLVSIQYTKVDEAPQLDDFLARCHQRGIKANIWVPGAHPSDPAADDDLEARGFLDLIEALDPAGCPAVFGYDLAWEPLFGSYDARSKHDPLWRTWIDTQYGSVTYAEKVWGCPAARANGNVTSPSNDQLESDGPHRVMVAAYRRFKDDLVSQRYREIIRLISRTDPTHLFGARTGCGGTGTRAMVPLMQYQITSGAAHLDFLSPEGWGYSATNIRDAAFVSRYTQWAGNNKPVFWCEFGLTVWKSGDEGLQQQLDVYQAFHDMILDTGMAGWAGWWFPGGYRVDERSDYGIIAPDRTPRPSAVLVGESGPVFQNATPPTTDSALSVERDLVTAGLAGVIEANRDAFTALWDQNGVPPHIRTAGTGTDSLTCPLTGVGGVPFEAPQPAQYMNAELVVTEQTADRLRVEAINTGEAAWAADDCTLLVKTSNQTIEIPITSAVPRFGRIEIEVATSGPCIATMSASRFGLFGERLKVTGS